MFVVMEPVKFMCAAFVCCAEIFCKLWISLFLVFGACFVLISLFKFLWLALLAINRTRRHFCFHWVFCKFRTIVKGYDVSN